jgi:hypothetical protein
LARRHSASSHSKIEASERQADNVGARSAMGPARAIRLGRCLPPNPGWVGGSLTVALPLGDTASKHRPPAALALPDAISSASEFVQAGLRRALLTAAGSGTGDRRCPQTGASATPTLTGWRLSAHPARPQPGWWKDETSTRDFMHESSAGSPQVIAAVDEPWLRASSAAPCGRPAAVCRSLRQELRQPEAAACSPAAGNHAAAAEAVHLLSRGADPALAAAAAWGNAANDPSRRGAS